MKNSEKSEVICKKPKSSKPSNEQQNISLFVNFLKLPKVQEIRELFPSMDMLVIKISFDEHDEPSMMLSDYITLHGTSMFPFTKAFTDEVSCDMQYLKGTEDDIGIEVSIFSDENGKTIYKFCCDMSKM